ncbi:MAG: hypothetical protein C5B52_14570 [Bacteroidetes bacterium]|nr:MAG: hypothetical protein C5B52_14570 [Bacteroidota bacterium]
MRRIILKILIIVLPMGLIVGCINFFVDPANIFSGESYSNGIAAILSGGHNVDNISNFDERLLQVKMVQRLITTPDICVLGSSRIWEIGSDFYPGKIVMNCGVPGATLDDVVSIVGLLDSLHHLPKEIIINLDPFLVSENLNSDWHSLKDYHNYLLLKLNLPSDYSTPPHKYDKLLNLFSLNYFKGSCEFLIQGKSKHFEDVGTARPTRYGKYFDGTIAYPEKFLHPDTSLTSILAKDMAAESGFVRPDPNKIALLNKLLDYLAKNFVNVKLLLIPYHPEYYHYVQNHRANLFDQYDQDFRKLAGEHKLSVTGNFDPTLLHINKNAFYDAYHLDKAHLKELILESK